MINSELKQPLKGAFKGPNGVVLNQFGRGSETFNQNGHKLSVYSMPSSLIQSPNSKHADANGQMKRM